jgi:hypothetical protein
MRFRTHLLPALDWEILRTVDPTPPGESDGGGAPPADPHAGGDSAGGEPSDDVARLKRALEAERNLKRQLEAQLREVGQVNPQLVAEAQAKAEAAEQQRQLIEQQTTARLADQERKYQEQLQRITGDLQAAKTAAEREALRIKTEREFLAAKGLVEASAIDGRTPFDYIWQLYGSQFAEDKTGLYLVDGDGSPRLDSETGRRITPGEFFAKLRKDQVHGMHFQPEFGSGSGGRSGRDGRAPSGRSLESMNSKDLIKEGLRQEMGKA